MDLIPYHAKYYAFELTKRCPIDSVEKLAGALVDAQVDLNPHRIEAALFVFRSKPDRYPNLTIEQIPKAVLSRCEWGKDDYSLQVENLPKAPHPPGQMELISVAGD